jgi:hypothetical protein
MATETRARLHVTDLPSVEPYLDDELRPLVAGALEEMARVSARHGIMECDVEVSDFVSAEWDDDEPAHVVLTQLIDEPIEFTGDYLEQLAIAQWQWADTLPPRQRDTVHERIWPSVWPRG